MAQVFRRQPSTQTEERPKPRVSTGGGNNAPAGRVARLRTSIDDILAELRKVTWPSREETRNLTIVVIGISVTLGIFLGGIDLIFSSLYRAISGG
jgi:preprotein translocase subunit SecE